MNIKVRLRCQHGSAGPIHYKRSKTPPAGWPAPVPKAWAGPARRLGAHHHGHQNDACDAVANRGHRPEPDRSSTCRRERGSVAAAVRVVVHRKRLGSLHEQPEPVLQRRSGSLRMAQQCMGARRIAARARAEGVHRARVAGVRLGYRVRELLRRVFADLQGRGVRRPARSRWSRAASSRRHGHALSRDQRVLGRRAEGNHRQHPHRRSAPLQALLQVLQEVQGRRQWPPCGGAPRDGNQERGFGDRAAPRVRGALSGSCRRQPVQPRTRRAHQHARAAQPVGRHVREDAARRSTCPRRSSRASTIRSRRSRGTCSCAERPARPDARMLRLFIRLSTGATPS